MNVARLELKSTKLLDATAKQIATAFGETQPVPLMHIRRIVQTCGPDRALQVLEQAVARES